MSSVYYVKWVVWNEKCTIDWLDAWLLRNFYFSEKSACCLMCHVDWLYAWGSWVSTEHLDLWQFTLQCVAVCCSMLQCVAVCCSVLQYVAVCCRVLQCVAVCCSVLQLGEHCALRSMTLSTWNTTPPKSTKSTNLDSSISRGTNWDWNFGVIWICAEEFEFPDLVDLGGVAFLAETVIPQTSRAIPVKWHSTHNKSADWLCA